MGGDWRGRWTEGAWSVEGWRGMGRERGEGKGGLSFVCSYLAFGLRVSFFRPAETDFVLYNIMFRPIECVARRLDDPGYFADIKAAARSQMA